MYKCRPTCSRDAEQGGEELRELEATVRGIAEQQAGLARDVEDAEGVVASLRVEKELQQGGGGQGAHAAGG